MKERTKLDISTTIEYAAQIAETLNFAHANGLLHRNLTPESIIISEAGQVKLTGPTGQDALYAVLGGFSSELSHGDTQVIQ